MEKYNGRGTDLASYAQAMETEIAEGDVNVNSPVLLNLGIGENARASITHFTKRRLSSALPMRTEELPTSSDSMG